MSEAQRFRERAIDCRSLAKGARAEVDKALLEDIAAEFDAEADKIEARDEQPTEAARRQDHSP